MGFLSLRRGFHFVPSRFPCASTGLTEAKAVRMALRPGQRHGDFLSVALFQSEIRSYLSDLYGCPPGLITKTRRNSPEWKLAYTPPHQSRTHQQEGKGGLQAGSGSASVFKNLVHAALWHYDVSTRRRMAFTEQGVPEIERDFAGNSLIWERTHKKSTLLFFSFKMEACFLCHFCEADRASAKI